MVSEKRAVMTMSLLVLVTDPVDRITVGLVPSAIIKSSFHITESQAVELASS